MSKIKKHIPNLKNSQRLTPISSLSVYGAPSTNRVYLTKAKAKIRDEIKVPESKDLRLRGVALADDVFSNFDAISNISEINDHQSSEDVVPEGSYQLNFEFETLREIEDRLRHQIRKYEYGYEKMAIYAYRWYQLIEDISENDTLEQLFNDIQTMRKLQRDDLI